MRRRTRWFLILGVLGAAALSATLYARASRAPKATYTTAPVTQGHVESRVTASGTLSALVTVQVGAQVSGRLVEIGADFNSPVKKGQVIARLDPQPFEAALEQARANEAAARANLAKAKVQAADAVRQLERQEALYKDKLVAQADRDTAQANADAARAQVTSMSAQVAQATASTHQAEINLGYATITSPIDGVVISRNVDNGQTVAASLQAPTLFTIAEDLGRMQVDTSVAEGDVGRLSDGMTTSFTVDAYPGRKFDGTVRQVRNAATTVQNVVTYDAVIDVANPKGLLKPGMTANVTFVTAAKDNVLLVPNAALRYKPQRPTDRTDKSKSVWVVRPGTTEPVAVRVQVGITDGTVTEASGEGLAVNDAVVTDAGGAPAASPQGSSPRGTGGGGGGGARGGGLGRVL